jgi:PhnB protein
VDAAAARFVKAGGKTLRPLENQFYGDRSGRFQDPEGYTWTLAQHVEDVPPDEMQKRMAKMG